VATGQGRYLEGLQVVNASSDAVENGKEKSSEFWPVTMVW